MPFGIGPSPVNLGNVELKGSYFNAELKVRNNFEKKVEKIVDSGKISKEDYKQLKDSMVNGRESLNEILSNAGIASKKDLEEIFGRGKEHGVISISTLQKNELKQMLTGNVNTVSSTPLTTEEQTKVDKLKQSLSHDRTEISNRYNLKDFMFSPQISSYFKEHLDNEYSKENLNFLHDLKSSLNAPTRENLTDIYNKYIVRGSKEEINLPWSNKSYAESVFTNPNSTMSEMLTVMSDSSKEIQSLARDSFVRFKGELFSKAILSDALNQPESIMGNSSLNYLNSVIDVNKKSSPTIAKHAESAKSLTLKALGDILL